MQVAVQRQCLVPGLRKQKAISACFLCTILADTVQYAVVQNTAKLARDLNQKPKVPEAKALGIKQPVARLQKLCR